MNGLQLGGGHPVEKFRIMQLCTAFFLAVLVVPAAPLVKAASHSDAPLIKQDPQANITDVYAFVSEGVLNTVVHVRPYSEPGDGPHYDRFADDALYSIHITDPSSGETALRYDFKFSKVNPVSGPGLKNPDTVLSFGLGTEAGAIESIGGPTQNFTQSYTVTLNGEMVGNDLLTPPPNVGMRTTPGYNDSAGFAVSGATSLTELDPLTAQAIGTISTPAGPGLVFAGPREDGFYADVPGIFDLLDPRIVAGGTSPGQMGGGVDGFKGFNVLAYAIQVPLASLAEVPGYPMIGVYASVSRQRVRLLSRTGDPKTSGPFIQVNRMGNPLFNEVFVSLKYKDAYNRSFPAEDSTRFSTYALEPELARLLNLQFGTNIPETGRSDLASIFIPDVLRVQTDTGPVPLAGQTGFNRLSIFGGDMTGGVPSGWPNGRRFGDDVIDIALTALAADSVPGGLLGDNVNANDQIYHQVFPYSATPHAGTRNRKDPAPY